MFRKSTLLALAAAATFGLSILATASADARGHGGGGGGMRMGGGGGGFARMGGGGLRMGGGLRINRGIHGRVGHIGHRHIGHRPHFRHHRHVHHWPRWCRFHHNCWRPRIWVGGVYTGGYGYTAPVQTIAAPVAPVTSRCTCLTKEYTPEGAVLFKDVCTNEAAINPPVPVQQQSSLEPTPAPGYSYPPQAR
jgi:hypothetical protein